MFDEISLSEAVEFVVDNRGKTVPVQEAGFPLIATNCISNDNLYPEFSNVRYVSDEVYENWFRAHPEPDDIILTNKGSKNGAICLVPNPVSFCIAQDMVALRAKSGVVYPRYLFAVLRSSLVQNRIKDLNVDSVIPHFKKTDFNKLHFPLPDYKRQVVIGDCYYNYCQKIELNRQTNKTLECIAQAIFKSWFVDFEPTRAKIAAKKSGQDPARAAVTAIIGLSSSDAAGAPLEALDQFNEEPQQQLKTTAALFPDALVNSELGEMPEGWVAKPLYETAEYINGNVFKAKDLSSGGEGLPIIKIVELKSGLSEGTKYTTGEFKKRYSIQNDDVLYSWSGSPETSLEVFKWFGGDGWLNQHIFKLNFETDEKKYFAYYLLRHMKPILIATAQQKQTTGLGHVTVADMKRLLVAYPENKLLCQFKRVVAPMYDKCSALDKESIALVNLRDKLLPKLLSGDDDLGAVA